MTQDDRFQIRRVNDTDRFKGAPFAQARELAYALEGEAFIAGGMARKIALGDEAPDPSDIDIFCLHKDGFPRVEKIVKALGYRYSGAQGSAEAWERDAFAEITVQLVPTVGIHNEQHRFGSPTTVIGDFTFITEMFALWADGESSPLRVAYTNEAERDTKYKRIRFNRLVSPIYATWRIAKYARKGYHISLAETQKLFAAWDNLGGEQRNEMLGSDASGGDLYREIGGFR